MNTFGFVGIDAAKEFHVFTVKDAQKRSLIPSLKISDDEHGYHHLRQSLDALKEKHNIVLFHVGIEATGTYHTKLVNYLRTQADVVVTILNPLQTSHYLKSDLRRASTDKVSAEVIALYLVEKHPASTHFLPETYETAKHLAKHAHNLTKQKSAAINRLRNHLGLLWPEFERQYSNLNALQVLALLSIAQTPQQVLGLDFAAHKTIMVCGVSYTLRSNFIHDVGELAKTSQPRLVKLSLEPLIKSLAEHILFLIEQLDQTSIELRKLFHTDADSNGKPLLSSIKGVGDETAYLMTALFGDINRFSSTKQAVAFFGLNPRVHDSGNTVRGKRYIQKRGPSLPRYYLFNCVLSMIRDKDHLIAKFYNRLLNKGKPKMVALVACMRKLVVIMFSMLKSNTPFSNSYVT